MTDPGRNKRMRTGSNDPNDSATTSSDSGGYSKAEQDEIKNYFSELSLKLKLPADILYGYHKSGTAFYLSSAAKTAIRSEVNPIMIIFAYIEPPKVFQDCMIKRTANDSCSKIIVVQTLAAKHHETEELLNVYIIYGERPALTSFGVILNYLPGGSFVLPQGIYMAYTGQINHYNELLHWARDPPLVIDFTSEDLERIICSPTIKWPEKIVSVMYHVYPHTRIELSTKFEVVSVDDYIDLKGDIGSSNLANSSTPMDKKFPIVLGLLLLGPSWSRDDNLARQIKSRVDAALASLSCSGVDLAQVEEIRGLIGFEKCFGNADIEDALGFWLSVDKSFKLNHSVTNDTMASTNELSSKYKWLPLMEAFFKQGRMVYSYFKTSTIRFAKVMIEVLKGHERTMGSEVTQELGKLKNLFETIDDFPFYHLRGTIPENSQIINFPRLCYLGLMYHLRNISNPKDKAEFGNYALHGPAHFITREEDKRALDDFVGHLPTPTIRTLIRMAQTLDATTFAQVSSSHPPDLIEKIYIHLRINKLKSAWGDEEFDRRESVVFISEIQQWRDLLYRRVTESQSNAVTLLLTEQDVNVRIRKQGEIDGWGAKMRNAIDSVVNATPRPTTGLLEHERTARNKADREFKTVADQVKLGFNPS